MALSMAHSPDTQLVLQLWSIDELFNAPDVNPFSSREIDVLGEAGVDVLWKRMVKRWPQRSDLQRVIVQLPPDQLTPDLAKTARMALQRYCAAKIEDNRRQRRFITRKALRLLGYSALILLFALALMFLFYVGPLQFLPGWLRGILTILAAYAASLAIWDSLDSLLFDWAPFVRDNATYRLISAIEVIVEPQRGMNFEQPI
jgi:hypothetical protein